MTTKLFHLMGAVLASVFLFAACGGDEQIDLGDCPPNSQRQQDVGQDLIRFSCKDYCHTEARVGADRAGAPANMNFDTEEQVLSFAHQIYASVKRNVNPMPPGGSLLVSQKEAVRVYLTCALDAQ